MKRKDLIVRVNKSPGKRLNSRFFLMLFEHTVKAGNSIYMVLMIKFTFMFFSGQNLSQKLSVSVCPDLLCYTLCARCVRLCMTMCVCVSVMLCSVFRVGTTVRTMEGPCDSVAMAFRLSCSRWLVVGCRLKTLLSACLLFSAFVSQMQRSAAVRQETCCFLPLDIVWRVGDNKGNADL